jgi:putative ABC transport system substrate-binding protein
MRRRQFIAGLGSTAVWPLSARAQQSDRVRRIGVLSGLDENDPMAKNAVSAFAQALADLGWTDGRNVRIDLRWGHGDKDRIRTFARELVGLPPDIIVTAGNASSVAFQRETRTIPIVFALVGDPVASGPPEWERHRLCQLRSLAGRQVACAALGDRAWAQARRNHVQS